MRGTGLSDAVDCPALQAGLIQESIAIGHGANQLGPHGGGAYTPREAAEDKDPLRPAPPPRRSFFHRDPLRPFLGPALPLPSIRSGAPGRPLPPPPPGPPPTPRPPRPPGCPGRGAPARTGRRALGPRSPRPPRVVDPFHRDRRSTESLIPFLLEAGTLAPRS